MVREEFTYLIDGRIFSAVRILYESYFGMWFIVILYLLFKTILFIRTNNVNLSFVTSILFLGVITSTSMLVGSSVEFLYSNAFRVCVAITIFELAGVLYNAIWKK